MSRFNEGGMHYILYHRRNKEFDDDTNFVISKKSKMLNKPKQIIYYKGKKYLVIREDKDGNKTVIPYNTKKKKHK